MISPTAVLQFIGAGPARAVYKPWPSFDETVEMHITTVMELQVDKASVPAGGPFIVLLPAGGPFIFLPLVDKASVTAGGPFIFRSTLLNVTADVLGPFIFCLMSQLTFRCILSQLSLFVTADALDRGGQRASCSFVFNASDLINLFV